MGKSKIAIFNSYVSLPEGSETQMRTMVLVCKNLQNWVIFGFKCW